MNPNKIITFAFGPITGALLGFITLPLITWFFTQEDIGRLAMLSVVTSFSTLLFSLGLDQAYVREFHESSNRTALFKTVFMPGLVLILMIIFLLLSIGNIISIKLFGLDSFLLSTLVAVVIVATFISRFLSLILRMNEQGLAYSMSQVLPKLLLIIIVGSYILFPASITKNITALLFANVASVLFVVIIYGWNTRKEWFLSFKQEIDFNYLKSLLSYSIPLIFGGLAFWGLTATDKVLLKELSNFEQLGLYSVSVSFAAAASVFQSIFSIVWMPTVYKWAAAGEKLDKVYQVNHYVLLAVVVLFCLAGLFSSVVTYILPSNYNEVQWILISCLGYPLFYILSETTVIGIGITRRSTYSMLAAALAFGLNLFGNWCLIPIYGAAGAAVSTCVSFFFFLLLRTEFSIYVWKAIPRLKLYSYSLVLVCGSVLNTLYGRQYALEFNIFWLILLSSVFVAFKEQLSEAKNWISSSLN